MKPATRIAVSKIENLVACCSLLVSFLFDCVGLIPDSLKIKKCAVFSKLDVDYWPGYELFKVIIGTRRSLSQLDTARAWSLLFEIYYYSLRTITG